MFQDCAGGGWVGSFPSDPYYSRPFHRYTGYGRIVEARRIHRDRYGKERLRHTLVAVLVQNQRDHEAARAFVLDLAKQLPCRTVTSILEDGVEVARVRINGDGGIVVERRPSRLTRGSFDDKAALGTQSD